jgi:DNA-binding response OmpR family regulator
MLAEQFCMDRPKFVPPTEAKTYEVPEEEIPSKVSVLLLEDEPDFAEMVTTYLETMDYVVTVVRDGVEGMRKIVERDFDAIICDLLMPNLPGDMFYLGVERLKPALSKRFVFITGHQGNPKIMEFLRKVRGIALFKPFQMQLLIEALEVIRKKQLKSA